MNGDVDKAVSRGIVCFVAAGQPNFRGIARIPDQFCAGREDFLLFEIVAGMLIGKGIRP